MSEKVDIYFIAKEAKVSPATISRVFNRSELVSEKTRIKILGICDKYDYKPSVVASSMRTNRTKYIGFVVPNLTNPFFFELLRGAEDFAGERDYYLVVFNSENSYEKELVFLDAIFKRRIDGIIISGIAGGKKDNFFTKEILKKKLPCVLVDRYIEGFNIPSVVTNNFKGGMLAADYLLKINNKRIGIITFELKIKIIKDRYNGFKKILDQNGLKEDFIIEIPVDSKNIIEELKKNKEKILKNKIDAIFCLSDFIAIYLIEFLHNAGLKIPEDLSVMGFDNLAYSEFIYPKLTTIAQDIYKMGNLSCEMLFKSIIGSKDNYVYKSKILDPKLLVRKSCLAR
jgi:LacI family transcriptional regulator